jgi:uncharacterized membrane protein YedE/YeeE
MSRRAAGLAVGLVFGVAISWSGMTAPNVIRGALLFQHAYLYLFMVSAMVVATAGSWLLRRVGATAIFGGQKIGWSQERPQRRHIVGALIFGVGWGVGDACPGPVATQLGQGIAWGLWTLAGLVIGVVIFLRRERIETEPATDAVAVTAPREAELGSARLRT